MPTRFNISLPPIQKPIQIQTPTNFGGGGSLRPAAPAQVDPTQAYLKSVGSMNYNPGQLYKQQPISLANPVGNTPGQVAPIQNTQQVASGSGTNNPSTQNVQIPVSPNPSDTQYGMNVQNQFPTLTNMSSDPTVPKTPQNYQPANQDNFGSLSSLQQTLNDIKQQYQLSPGEVQTQQDIIAGQNSNQLAVNNLAGQGRGIPDHLIRGQQEKLFNQGQIGLQTLNQKLALQQAQRLATLDASKFALGQQQQNFATQSGKFSPFASPFGDVFGFNTNTGKFSGGPNGAGGQSATGIDSLAQQIVSGQLSPSAAEAYLSTGPQKLALNQAIQKIQPGFQITQADQNFAAQGAALNQTATTYRTLVNGQQAVLDHFNTLDKAFNALPSALKTNFGPLNTVLGSVAGMGNNENYRAFQSALPILRDEIAKVLGGGSGATVESMNQAKSIIPDNLNLSAWNSVKNTIKELMAAKVKDYQNLNNIPQFGAGGQQQNSQQQGNVIQTRVGAINPNF
jgi:hypothetical protein